MNGIMVANIEELERLHTTNPGLAREIARQAVVKGLKASRRGGSRLALDEKAKSDFAPGTILGAGGGACYDRSIERFGCTEEEICELGPWQIPSVVMDSGIVIETDFDTLTNFRAVIDGLTFLEVTQSKDVAVVSAAPVAGTVTLLLASRRLSAGSALRWSVPYQLTQPAVVDIVTTNFFEAFNTASPRNRTNVQVELPPGSNGGWIYLPGAYRSASGMMQGGFQLVQTDAAVAVPEVTISNVPANMLWEHRYIGAFNTWTQNFVATLKKRYH